MKRSEVIGAIVLVALILAAIILAVAKWKDEEVDPEKRTVKPVQAKEGESSRG